jgi:hypothetical protein
MHKQAGVSVDWGAPPTLRRWTGDWQLTSTVLIILLPTGPVPVEAVTECYEPLDA